MSIVSFTTYASSLTTHRIVFGKYPTDDEAQLLADIGISLFVDLTMPTEITWTPYRSPSTVRRIVLPIPDRRPRGDPVAYRRLIDELLTYINKGETIYIHCRGGHGRSGTMAAILYALRTGVDATIALKMIREAHQERTEMSDKMRKLGSPQTATQKRFVSTFLDEVRRKEMK